MPRFYCPLTLPKGATVALPASAARHVQVLRLQPGAAITLFDGSGDEIGATVARMGRGDVDVTVGARRPVDREAAFAVHLALGVPANERMDWLVEKATELGVASIQPLQTAHGVLRLAGERAERRMAHWQAIAVAACEQCGRNRVPVVHPLQPLPAWLAGLPVSGSTEGAARLILSLASDATPIRPQAGGAKPGSSLVLSGPEGGLDDGEEALARATGFIATGLGPRVLRAETAALAALLALNG